VDTLASLFVGKPFNIAAVAVLFLAGGLVLRFAVAGPRRHPAALLVAAAAWTLYALWEWLVQARTPEANIRVDLLLIWPVLAILSAWMVLRALRGATP
jgi:hypothetical protein